MSVPPSPRLLCLTLPFFLSVPHPLSCLATEAKTVELLCTNWLKSMRFDPILLLERLNPVLNESGVLEDQAGNVLLDGGAEEGSIFL